MCFFYKLRLSRSFRAMGQRCEFVWVQSILLCCFFVSNLGGCASSLSKLSLRPEKLEDQSTLRAKPFATVIAVNQPHHFVLLDTASHAVPSPGAFLASISGSKQTALFRVSPQSHPPFLIADIIEGKPFIGERVFRVLP